MMTMKPYAWLKESETKEDKPLEPPLMELPNIDWTHEDDLRDDRKIYLDKPVDEKTLNIQRLLIFWNLEDAGKPAQERQPIILYICSPGGDTDYMWSLIDTIQASETPVYTVNIAAAYSAAGLIFMAGHKRLMFRNAQVLVHEGFAMMAGDGRKVLDASDNYRALQARMRQFIAKRTGLSMEALTENVGRDWYMDADYCLEHHVCDAIVEKLSEVI